MPDDADPYNVDKIIGILQKQTKGGDFDRSEVQSRLANKITAVGKLMLTDDMFEEEIEYAQLFNEEAGEPTYTPKKKAEHYQKILASSDPLDKELIHSIYKAEINARAHGRKPKDFKKPSNFDRSNLTDRLCQDLALLRQVAEELKIYNEQMVQPGAPIKQPQYTLLPMLAGLYVELTNQDISPFDLPHGENSRFIKFCDLALQPHFDKTEVGTGALSKAWKRIKDGEKGRVEKQSKSR